jgi:hypothetical protein
LGVRIGWKVQHGEGNTVWAEKEHLMAIRTTVPLNCLGGIYADNPEGHRNDEQQGADDDTDAKEEP